jgi:hypothetical protein
VAVAAIVEHAGAPVEGDTPTGSGGDDLAGFRSLFYGCMRSRADALFELVEAVLCGRGPVVSLPELSLEPVHRRGHGAMYDALAAGRVQIASLRRSLAGLVLPRASNGQIRLAVDVSAWPRPDAECSADRCHAHRPCRCDGIRQTIPGWPYSMVAGLESGRSSWTALLDAVRLRPDDDATELTATQIRGLVARLEQAGQWHVDDPPILVVMDAGYDVVRLAFLLQDLPVLLVARVRSDRVFYAPAAPAGGPGRPARHGASLRLAEPASWPDCHAASTDLHPRYGNVSVQAWARMHPQLARRGGWSNHPGKLPIIEGTLIRIRVDRLPGDRAPKPVWLWHSHPEAAELDLQRVFRIFLRRFDIEHTFRFLKQTLGWTRPRLRTPQQADRWTWLIIAAYTQLRLARGLATDLRRPWEAPLDPDRLTPARVRRGFPRIRRTVGLPASAPKPTRPGPGRPKGSRNRHKANRYTVGKQPKVDISQVGAATT